MTPATILSLPAELHYKTLQEHLVSLSPSQTLPSLKALASTHPAFLSFARSQLFHKLTIRREEDALKLLDVLRGGVVGGWVRELIVVAKDESGWIYASGKGSQELVKPGTVAEVVSLCWGLRKLVIWHPKLRGFSAGELDDMGKVLEGLGEVQIGRGWYADKVVGLLERTGDVRVVKIKEPFGCEEFECVKPLDLSLKSLHLEGFTPSAMPFLDAIVAGNGSRPRQLTLEATDPFVASHMFNLLAPNLATLDYTPYTSFDPHHLTPLSGCDSLQTVTMRLPAGYLDSPIDWVALLPSSVEEVHVKLSWREGEVEIGVRGWKELLREREVGCEVGVKWKGVWERDNAVRMEVDLEWD